MMRPSTLFLSLVLGAIALPAGAQEGSPLSGTMRREAVAEVLENTVDGFIRPGYRTLKEATISMAAAAESLCTTPTEETLGDAQLSFDELIGAWSSIEIVRIGPVIEGNRFERFLFYPDRKGTGLRQVQALLAKPYENATDAASLKGKSVAMQGLGALEFVLYGTGWEELLDKPQSFRCRYGAAIADNLKSVAEELSAEWEKPGGIQDAWKKPGPANPVFRDEKEAATAVLGILVHATEAVKDQRLMPFYRGTVEGKADKGRPKLAIYWRSDNTMPSITANIAALRQLWEVSGMRTLLSPDFASVAGSVDFVFGSLLRVAGTIDQPIDQVLANDAGRGKLDFVLLNTGDLLDRLNREFGGAIGLGAGFSFADGD